MPDLKHKTVFIPLPLVEVIEPFLYEISKKEIMIDLQGFEVTVNAYIEERETKASFFVLEYVTEKNNQVYYYDFFYESCYIDLADTKGHVKKWFELEQLQ